MNGGSLHGILQAFADLHAADRAAVVKRLSLQDRRRLAALQDASKTPIAGNSAHSLPDWSDYSPALSRHLMRLVADADAGRSRLTPSTQAALHDCLSTPGSRT